MAEVQQNRERYSQMTQEAVSHPVIKATAAVTVGGSLLVLSGLVLAGTVIALTVVTPLMMIFSPVLVPAGIAMFLMTTGFVTSGGLGLAALSVLTWMYKYLTGKQPPGADQLDEARRRFAEKGREVKDSAQHRMELIGWPELSFSWYACT